MTVLSQGRSKLRSWTEVACMMMPYPKVSMGGRLYRACEVMDPRSPVPVLPEWQVCISLKDGLATLKAESQEDGNGNR